MAGEVRPESLDATRGAGSLRFGWKLAFKQVGATWWWEPETCPWCQGQGFRDARRGGKKDGGRGGRLPGQEVGARLGLLQGALSQPKAPTSVARQPTLPPVGGTSWQFRPAVFAGRPALRGTSGSCFRRPAFPRQVCVRVRGRLRSASGLAASGTSTSSAAAHVPAAESGFAGLVSAPFSRAHVLLWFRGALRRAAPRGCSPVLARTRQPGSPLCYVPGRGEGRLASPSGELEPGSPRPAALPRLRLCGGAREDLWACGATGAAPQTSEFAKGWVFCRALRGSCTLICQAPRLCRAKHHEAGLCLELQVL